MSVLLSLSHLLEHHLLVLLLCHLSLTILSKRWRCSMIIHDLSLWWIYSSHLLLSDERGLFLVRQSSNRVIFKMAIHIGWNQSILCTISWIINEICIHHILFAFLINLWFGSLLKELLLLSLVICHILVLNLNGLALRLSGISILLGYRTCFITVSRHG